MLKSNSVQLRALYPKDLIAHPLDLIHHLVAMDDKEFHATNFVEFYASECTGYLRIE